MSEEKQPSKAQLFFMDHGEKIALGAAGGMVLIYLVVFASSGGNPDVEAVKTSAKEIHQQSTLPHKDTRTAPNIKNSAEKYHEFEGTWGTPAVGNAFPAGDWVTTLLTRENAVEVEFVEKREKPWELASLQFDTLQATAKGITLSWTSVSPEDADKKNIAEIDLFIVERKDQDGTRKKLGEVPGDNLTWLDEDVKKKTTYQYRITPVTKDAGYIGAHFNGKGSSTGWKTVTSIDIWKITFKSPEPEKKRVYVTIEKDDKAFGKVKETVFQYVGDKIGWWEDTVITKVKDPYEGWIEKKERKVTSKHRINNKEVNFDTGRTITAIEIRVYKITRKECNIEKGSCTGLIDTVRLEKYEVPVVVYTDEDGKEHTWFEKNKDPQNHPQRKPMYKCDKHRSSASD